MRARQAPGQPGVGATGDGTVTESLWRGLVVLRFILLAQALVINLARSADLERPLLGWSVLAGMAAWTLLISWVYDAPERRRWPALAADLAVAAAALLSSKFILSEEMLREHAFSVPSYWIAAPVLAWAIHAGWPGGVLAAAAIVPADFWSRYKVTATTLGNSFLLLLAAFVIGYCSTLMREAAAERARATELAARTAERERLARAVHDSVLQVLAYVERRGAAIGGEAAELGRAAGEQGERLRSLIRGGPGPIEASGGRLDLVRCLADFGATDVTVALPAEPVLVPSPVAQELIAAVREVLDNTREHAPGAHSYILLEQTDDDVTISVRDDGPGIPAGRLEEAAAAGRMGVSHSIIGRMEELGGSAKLRTAPGEGTEWELTIPR
ncbi:MAG TPA: DUF5931 domain-containing protein [Actinopolymorphaceae bacterium]